VRTLQQAGRAAGDWQVYGEGGGMRAADIKQRLSDRAEEFARYLFPAGRKSGNEWLVGSLAGETASRSRYALPGQRLGFGRTSPRAKGGAIYLSFTYNTKALIALKRCGIAQSG